MHDLTELGSNIPAFLAKLWTLVDDPSTDNVISWSSSGQSFIITKPSRFAQELLPKYFKHKNMASFTRQLNMYGFHKVASIDSGGLKSENDTLEFTHTCFFKGHPYLLEQIKRKMSNSKTSTPFMSCLKDDDADEKAPQNKVLAQILNEINTLKSRQSNWDAKLTAMKRENETLWRELAIFRQKHQQQSQIINKLIHFIVTMVQPTSRNVGLNRRYPLMLSDGLRSTNGTSSTATGSTSSGPTIRELDPTEFVISDLEKTNQNLDQINSSSAMLLSETNGLGETRLNSYVVLSPSNVSESAISQPASNASTSFEPSTWLNDGDSDQGDGMKMINPMHVHEITKVTDTPIYVEVKPAEPKKGKIVVQTNPTRSAKRPKRSKGKNIFSKRRKNSIENVNELVSSGTPTLISIPDNGQIEIVPDSSIPVEWLSNDVDAGNTQGISIVKMSPVTDTGKDEQLPQTGKNPGTSELEEFIKIDPNSLSLVKPNYNPDCISRDLGSHVEEMQGDIDILKDFFKCEGLDASTFLEFFNEDPLSYNLPPSLDDKGSKETGGELMTYEPSLLDLVDLYGSTSNLAASASPPSSSSFMDSKSLATPSPSPRYTGQKRK